MTKDEAVRKCIQCKKCEFERIELRGLTEENMYCPIAQTVWLPEDKRKSGVVELTDYSQYAVPVFKVWYHSKFNNRYEDYYIRVLAKSAKEAKDKCRKLVHEATGRHAFGITVMRTGKVPKYFNENAVEGYPPPKL